MNSIQSIASQDDLNQLTSIATNFATAILVFIACLFCYKLVHEATSGEAHLSKYLMATSDQQKLRVLVDTAEERQYLENPIYALLNEILMRFSQTLTADPGCDVIHPYPQPRLVPHPGGYVISLSNVKSATPDFSLAISRPGDEGNVMVILIEVKRLCCRDRLKNNFPSNPNAPDALPISWADKVLSAQEASVIFSENITQIMFQAWCGFACTKQEIIYHIFVSGIYFWLLEFNRPEGLMPFTVYHPSDFGFLGIYNELMPPTSQPKVLIAAQCIFDQPENPRLQFSAAWLKALRIACESGQITQAANAGIFSFANAQYDQEADHSRLKREQAETAIISWYLRIAKDADGLDEPQSETEESDSERPDLNYESDDSEDSTDETSDEEDGEVVGEWET
ncbi:hypothetical protein BDN72DRAFT_966185 [Pluteus cervinus]|uniref:Uncharacterized protein n=1 Tax=Pluteus cervinus TaxID=181527 RepID=A0ACD2ZZM9_9AGAR|nr:hypothetical protein BDN72DRAFT_966185 [Pluteus cervinus]